MYIRSYIDKAGNPFILLYLPAIHILLYRWLSIQQPRHSHTPNKATNLYNHVHIQAMQCMQVGMYTCTRNKQKFSFECRMVQTHRKR
jgi:hypothetical protein